MLHWFALYNLRARLLMMRQDLMPIRDQVSYNWAAILRSSCQNLMANSYTNRVTSIFMLFHDISTAWLCVFRCIFVMNVYLRVHAYGDYSSQVIVSFITKVGVIAAPVCDSCYWALMLLESFHLSTIFYVYCKNTALTVTHEQFTLTRV